MRIGWTMLALVSVIFATTSAADAPDLTERQVAEHVLNRMAFGPRPGQVEAVIEMGVREWIEQQLDPSSIENDAVERHVAEHWPTLMMTMQQVREHYQPPYPREGTPEEKLEAVRQRNRLRYRVAAELPRSVLYRATFSERQFEEVIVTFWRNHFSIDQNKDDVAYYANDFERTLRRYAFGDFERLLLATAQHPAMLMFLDNDVSQKPLTEREERLLARYEARNRVPRSVEALGRHRGLNENYARELMELHTLGVDNGYTQRDVTELARVLTGWTAGMSDGGYLGEPGETYGFLFRTDVHDTDIKRVLGSRITGNRGVRDGINVVIGLANHPTTANFISYKLCRYLLNDEPGDALVNRVARMFRRSDGDLPKVYEAIVTSDEFLRPANYRAKFKTPLEFVVSSLRVTDARVTDYRDLLRSLDAMGYDVYGCIDPTGYYDQAEAWLDPGVMVRRWQFAVRLATDDVDGVTLPPKMIETMAGNSQEQTRDAIVAALLPGGVDEQTNTLLLEQMSRLPGNRYALGLVLGSPVFQQQ